MKRIHLVAAVAVALTAAFALHLARNDATSSARGATPAQATGATSSARVQPIAASAATIAGRATPANPYLTQRAVALLNPGRYPAALAVDHEQMLMRSIAACTPIPPEMRIAFEKKINSLLQSEKRSVMAYQAFVNRYCEGFSTVQAQQLLDGAFRGRKPSPEEAVTDRVVRTMLASAVPGDLSRVDAPTAQALQDIAASTPSPQLFEQSAFFLLRTQHAPDAMFSGLEDSVRMRFVGNPALAHHAVATARCRMFGGCDADSLLTMQSCFPNYCGYAARYGDKSGNDLTPSERELAQVIAQRLIAARK